LPPAANSTVLLPAVKMQPAALTLIFSIVENT
jgi:hypothetical protein